MKCLRNSVLLLAATLVAGCEPGPPTPARGPASGPPVGTATAGGPAQTGRPPSTSAPPTPIQPGGPSDSAIQASNRFGFALFQKVRAQAGNLAMSPASMSLALSMTYGGARGETAKQMAKVMHLPADAEALHGGWATVLSEWRRETAYEVDGKRVVEIAVANRLFGQQGYTFEKPFLAHMENRYGAPLELLDFKGAPERARSHINGWVKQQTRDRIVDLITPGGIQRDTRLVLTNALYFKGAWSQPFDKSLTRDEAFTTGQGKRIDVPMMNQTASARYAEIGNVQLLELRYSGGPFATLFVLPNQGRKLADVEAKLTHTQLDAWLRALRTERVRIALPRFKVEPPKSLELSRTLVAMGMTDAFDQKRADFTGMAKRANPGEELYIQKVFHKAFVAMDEVGTEAAAATAVVMGEKTAAPPPKQPKVFRADRPFLFLILDTKGDLVTFVGRVDDPSIAG